MQRFSAIRRFAPVYLRLALGVAFLSAVADRFGLWGPPGAGGVAWGDFAAFEASTARLNPYLPASAVPALAWLVTLMELGLGGALVLGVRLRETAFASGVLLCVFALAMTLTGGPKGALDYSVFTASAAALVLSRETGRATTDH